MGWRILTSSTVFRIPLMIISARVKGQEFSGVKVSRELLGHIFQKLSLILAKHLKGPTSQQIKSFWDVVVRSSEEWERDDLKRWRRISTEIRHNLIKATSSTEIRDKEMHDTLDKTEIISFLVVKAAGGSRGGNTMASHVVGGWGG